jgi:hypothetical protein
VYDARRACMQEVTSTIHAGGVLTAGLLCTTTFLNTAP